MSARLLPERGQLTPRPSITLSAFEWITYILRWYQIKSKENACANMSNRARGICCPKPGAGRECGQRLPCSLSSFYKALEQTDSKRSTAQFYDIFTGIDENVLELFQESIVSDDKRKTGERGYLGGCSISSAEHILQFGSEHFKG